MDKGSMELMQLLEKIKKMTPTDFMEFYNSELKKTNFIPNVKEILKNDSIYLYILFSNNVIKKLSIRQVIADHPELNHITDYSLFHVATIYYDTYGIGWDGEFDVSRDYVWHTGEMMTQYDFKYLEDYNEKQ